MKKRDVIGYYVREGKSAGKGRYLSVLMHSAWSPWDEDKRKAWRTDVWLHGLTVEEQKKRAKRLASDRSGRVVAIVRSERK